MTLPSTSADGYQRPLDLRWAPPSVVARRFFGIALGVVGVATLIESLLMRTVGRGEAAGLRLVGWFALTTGLLGGGSYLLEQALASVRRERQARFRSRLGGALVIAACFMGTQTFALWTILPADRSIDAAVVGVTPFVLMLATLHGLHFLVATLFVSYVTAEATLGRYDHEYHWGVTVCAWFWHALGIAWLAILAVYAIAFRVPA